MAETYHLKQNGYGSGFIAGFQGIDLLIHRLHGGGQIERCIGEGFQGCFHFGDLVGDDFSGRRGMLSPCDPLGRGGIGGWGW